MAADFDIYSGLRTFLLTDPVSWGTLEADDIARRIAARVAIAAAVSTRIYPTKAPQTVTSPYIVLTRISSRHQNVVDQRASLALAVFQIDCWVRESSGAAAFSACQSLGANVRARLEAFHGTFTDPAGSPDRTTTVGVTFDTERDDYFSDSTGGYYRQSADYRIWYGVTGA